MKIGLYGDSTQAGVSVYGGVPTTVMWPPAKILQMMLDNKYGQGVHTVSNYGIGGSKLQGALTTNLFPEGNVYQHIAAKADDIIVANWGINDAFTPGLTGWTFASWVQALRNNVEAAGKVFIYETPNPLNEAHASIVDEFVVRVKTITGLKLIDNHGQIKTYYPQWAAHLSDGVHPNQIMYFWVGDFLFKSIDLLIPA